MKSLIILITLLITLSCTDTSNQDISEITGCLFPPTFEQEYRSLQMELDTSTVDSNIVKTYIKLSDLLCDTIPEKSIEYAQKGVLLSSEIFWNRGLDVSYAKMAYCYSSQFKDHYKAIEICKKALLISKNTTDSVHMGLNYARIGNFYFKIYKESDKTVFKDLVFNLLQAKDILKKKNVTHAVEFVNRVLYEAHKEYDDYKTALKYHEDFRLNEQKKWITWHSNDLKDLEKEHEDDIIQTKIDSYELEVNIITYFSIGVFLLLLITIYQLVKLKKLRKIISKY